MPVLEPPSVTVARHFARAASALATQASLLAAARLGPGHDAAVAARAADQAKEAAQTLERMAEAGASTETTMLVATWALSAAAVAITQAKLGATPDPLI